MEETLARMRQEVERRNAAKSEEARRRNKLLEDKKVRQEQILRENQEKLDRKSKKRMLEERWAMTRWVTKYIDENSERWALEKKKREESSKKWLEDCAKMTRFEKIRAIKEAALEENKPRIVTKIRPQKLVLRAGPHHDPHQGQPEQPSPEKLTHIASHQHEQTAGQSEQEIIPEPNTNCTRPPITRPTNEKPELCPTEPPLTLTEPPPATQFCNFALQLVVGERE